MARFRPHGSFRAAAADAVVATAELARVLALRVGGARSEYVSTRCGRIHVLDIPGQGSLPPVVLLHGISASAADFAPLLRRLRLWTRRIVAPDLPGHGFSTSPPEGASAEDILEGMREALDGVLDRPAIVFGNSLGGTVAIRYALRRPDRTSGLFLVSPAGAPCSDHELQTLFDLLRVEDLNAAREFMRRVLPCTPWTLELLARGARVRLSRPAVRRLIEQASPTDLLRPDEVGSLAVPVTLVWGQRERLLPPSHYAFFHRHLPPHARIEVPPAFGHAPFLDRPGDVANLLRDFAVDVGEQATISPPSPLHLETAL